MTRIPRGLGWRDNRLALVLCLLIFVQPAVLTRSVQAAPVAVALHQAQPCAWTGAWSFTSANQSWPMTLTQRGNQVTGSYANIEGNGTIDGTVSGNRFTGAWAHQRGASGRLELTLDPGCNRLTGT